MSDLFKMDEDQGEDDDIVGGKLKINKRTQS